MHVEVAVAPLASIHAEPAVNVSVAKLALAKPSSLVLVAGAPQPMYPNDSSDDETGPRYKPGVSPVPPTAPFPRMGSADRPEKKHLSVEERLDRIEHMLEDLQARHVVKINPPLSSLQPNTYGRPGTAPNVPSRFFSDKQAWISTDEVRSAVEASQRAAEQAMRDVAKLDGKNFARAQGDLRALKAQDSFKALEALREARGNLQNQVKTLEQEIKRLEEQQNRLKEQKGSEKSGDESKPQGPADKK
jgi:hypothetical protein